MRQANTILLLLAASCGTPAERVPPTFEGRLGATTVEVDGWLDTRGELRLFTSKRAMEKGAEYPQCISGVSENHSVRSFSSFDRKHVRVDATVWDYNALPNENDYELARKILGKSVITNWCKSPRVLLIRSVRLL